MAWRVAQGKAKLLADWYRVFISCVCYIVDIYIPLRLATQYS